MPEVTVVFGKCLDFIAFLGIFKHYWRPFLSEMLYPTKLLKIASSLHFFKCLHAKCDCRLCYLIQNVFKEYNFIKLLQTMF